jgi:hypothetical protein
MRLRLANRGERDERGAIAVLTAWMMVVFLAVAALGVDITTQVNQRQKLHDTIDAAAHAGAYDLPSNGIQARTDAVNYAQRLDPDLTGAFTPVPVFFCVVAALAGGGVDTTQIPAVCNPARALALGTPPRCNAKICSIPCNPTAGDVCNTISVTGTKPVSFSFAPAIRYTQPGSTGSVTSVACKGSCGTIPPNPMDVAVVADRTGSMNSTDIGDMIAGIKGMFQVMTPTQQYVALGTIGRSSSSAPSSCESSPTGSDTTGPWIPVPFSADYLTTGTKTINTSSTLVKAVNCLTNSSSTGTALASPMKSAARYLLGSPLYDANNLGSLPLRNGTPRKALIFETDGQPRETAPTAGYTTLNINNDIFSNTNDIMTVGSGTSKRYYYDGGNVACQNMIRVGAEADSKGILVITIAYNLSGVDCDSNDTSYTGTRDCKTNATACHYSVYATSIGTTPTKVIDALAAAASPIAPGVPSTAQNTCADSTQQGVENADGDYFFCAASGTVMYPIFKTALGQLAKGIKFVQLPP